MRKLPKIIIGLIFWAGCFVISFSQSKAVEIISQTQYDSVNTLYTWQLLQELGNNLTGTAQNFTFRINTSKTNLEQFDYTAPNSRIYDKDNSNSYISGCTPAGSSSNPMAGLTLNTVGVPIGYEDVTIDFSCRNYNFITGHKYLIIISNANMAQFGGKRIQFATTRYVTSGQDNFTAGGLRFTFDNSSCSPASYVWNSQNASAGCNILTSAKDDLYFSLTNTSPPPKTPVVFIPGIGGSELKAAGDIIWSDSDGHGGNYSHAYAKDEKIWVNQDEAIKLGDDDYFDVLRLKPDGVTSEANLGLTGNVNPYGYGEIESFFQDLGYIKDTNFFIFNYDWRRDVQTTKADLDNLIETAKEKSGQNKVNIVVHSLGGLVARNYIADSTKASKVNKLIELGVPHLGSVWAIKALMYGAQVGPSYLFGLIALNKNEVKDIMQNLSSNFQLVPASRYFDFYNNSNSTQLVPFRDDRDIDDDKITGTLNFNQTKNLLSNLGHNMTVFNIAEQFHNFIDPILNQSNGVKIYEIVGSNQPTLGQIHETWWITWPVNLIPKQDQVFINGDDTVPLYSASLKNDSLDISGATKIYYVEQSHGDLTRANGTGMQTVKSILNEDNSLPIEAKEQKIALEGQQISVDEDVNLDIYDDSGNHTGLKSNGEVETNIPKTFYDSLGKTKHIFVKKSASKVTAKVTSNKATKTKVKIRNYSQDIINKTIFYNDVPVDDKTNIQFTIDPAVSTAPVLTAGTQTILASAEVTGSAALDQAPPSSTVKIAGNKDNSGKYTGSPTIALAGDDNSSGVLKIEYSLDNGQTVQTYTEPFSISSTGKTIIQVKSIDKSGNEEIPQTTTLEIAVLSTATNTNNNSSSSTSSDTNSSTIATVNTSADSKPNPSVDAEKSLSNTVSPSPAVLGISSKKSNQIAKEEPTPAAQKRENTNQIFSEILDKLLTFIIILASGALLFLATTFIKPFPRKM